MSENLNKNFFKQKILASLFNLLMLGFKLCVIGNPSEFSTETLKTFLRLRGHYFFATDKEACFFLTATNQVSRSQNIFQVVLVFKKNNKTVNFFKNLGLFVIEINFNAKESGLALLEILYVLNKIPKSIKKGKE